MMNSNKKQKQSTTIYFSGYKREEQNFEVKLFDNVGKRISEDQFREKCK